MIKPKRAGRYSVKGMLRLEDCLALCDLTEDEVLAIAQHEHIPEMAAVQLGNYLVIVPGGEKRIKSIIRDDIADARARGDRAGELALKLVLRNFVLQHQRCDERCRAQMHAPERRVDGDQGSVRRPA
jgi:hypothetical protein